MKKSLLFIAAALAFAICQFASADTLIGSEITVSNQQTIDFTSGFSASCKTHNVVLTDLTTSASDTPILNVAVGGTPNTTLGDSRYAGQKADNVNVTPFGDLSTATYIKLTYSAVGTTLYINGNILFPNANGTGIKHIVSSVVDGAVLNSVVGTFVNHNASALSGGELRMSGGNSFVSGTVRVYCKD